jgi:hypothetical protein
MKDKHHCRVWYCAQCTRWHCECDGTPNCKWIDYHEVSNDAALAAVERHITEMHNVWTIRW